MSKLKLITYFITYLLSFCKFYAPFFLFTFYHQTFQHFIYFITPLKFSERKVVCHKIVRKHTTKLKLHCFSNVDNKMLF